MTKQRSGREYIRHPSGIPIEVSQRGAPVRNHERLHNVSVGGLSFYAPNKVSPGEHITIRIPVVEPRFEAHARVVWCKRATGEGYEVGVEFLDSEQAFRTRMVEQICHIEHYKNEIKEREGRDLNSEQAALEWIKKYAGKFPRL